MNAGRPLIAGVDLGGTKIQAVVIAGDEVVGEARAPTPRTDAADVLATIAAMIRCALDSGPPATTGDRLQAIGIGSPGAVDGATGTVSLASNVAGFMAPVPVGGWVSTEFRGIPVAVDNDVRVAVVGEHRRGAGRPFQDVLGVFVGTGVGGGIVLGGQLRRGAGTAGEIGHTTVRAGGRVCGCGRRGCLEAYAGRRSMETEARARVAAGEATELFQIMRRRGRDHLTSGVIERAVRKGDPMATVLVEDAIEALGIAIGSAHNLLDVEAVILGGGLVEKLGAPFVNRVQEGVAAQVFGRIPAVLAAGLGDLSGAVGAAVLAGERFGFDPPVDPAEPLA